jgi:hypothetical protein
MEPFRQVLAEHGLSEAEIASKLSMFMNNQTVFKREKAHA